MHELLTAASVVVPISGNAKGSYLTMRSKNGLIFGVINIIGCFATVFLDQAYWQRAIASRPATTVKAYLLGGLVWLASLSVQFMQILIRTWVGLPFHSLLRLHSV